MPDLEEVLVSVWRQSLVDGAKSVEIDGKKYVVKAKTTHPLKTVDSVTTFQKIDLVFKRHALSAQTAYDGS